MNTGRACRSRGESAHAQFSSLLLPAGVASAGVGTDSAGAMGIACVRVRNHAASEWRWPNPRGGLVGEKAACFWENLDEAVVREWLESQGLALLDLGYTSTGAK